MPYLNLQTNQKLPEQSRQSLMDDLTSFISEQLGKPEKYIMVHVADHQSMQMGGTNEPTVFLELRSIRLPQQETGNLAEKLTDFLVNSLELNGHRVFINFLDFAPNMWGCNGSTF